ncbi:MAG: 30S ribosomal protein S20 [Verrucomicrobiota bacterium]|nr:30S ribosomal protein S20 [Verrucomicrobiota bacterium]
MAEQKKAVKQSSAHKRNLQSERRRATNRSFRASVNTAIRGLRTSITKQEESTSVQEQLNSLYSMVDKGVKKGIFKPRKGARTKSRMTLLCQKKNALPGTL